LIQVEKSLDSFPCWTAGTDDKLYAKNDGYFVVLRKPKYVPFFSV
jgi:hypothetical protein